MIPLTMTQLLTVGVSLGCLILAFWWATRNRQRWLYIVPPVLIALHYVVFYILLAIKRSQGLDWNFFESWSSGIRLHSAISIFAMVLTYVLGLVVITIKFKD